jgi:hypothetical protein
LAGLRPLVLIGGGFLHGKRRHRVDFSLAGLRPLVLIGGLLPPSGSDVVITAV